jgi:predicted CXXCH cytochrome family protein
VRRFELVEPVFGKKTRNFWPDGRAVRHHQQWTEFVQSAHYAKAGLSCTTCHDPHERRVPGMLKLKPGEKPNTLCLGCHTDLRGDQALKAHTGHDPAKEGAVCVECHMPKLVANEQPMQLRHHGASIPNPRKTLLWGSPNACNLCHHDKAKHDTPQRMIDAMTKWGIPPMPIRVKMAE